MVHAGEGAAHDRIADGGLGWACDYTVEDVARGLRAALTGEDAPDPQHLRDWTLANASLAGCAAKAARQVLATIPDKTIVMTGALSPARFRGSDAEFNIGCAIGAVQSLPSGVQYRVIEAGKGAKPPQASTVQLEVAGPFPYGQRPTEARPAQQIPSIKVSEVEMKAMRETLLQMPAGSKWEVTLPPDQAYGADPRTPFPPNVAVQFEIKLVSVK